MFIRPLYKVPFIVMVLDVSYVATEDTGPLCRSARAPHGDPKKYRAHRVEQAAPESAIMSLGTVLWALMALLGARRLVVLRDGR